MLMQTQSAHMHVAPIDSSWSDSRREHNLYV